MIIHRFKKQNRKVDSTPSQTTPATLQTNERLNHSERRKIAKYRGNGPLTPHLNSATPVDHSKRSSTRNLDGVRVLDAFDMGRVISLRGLHPNLRVRAGWTRPVKKRNATAAANTTAGRC